MNILINFILLFLLSCSSVQNKSKSNDEVVNINDLYELKNIQISEKVPVNYGPSLIAYEKYEEAQKKEAKLFSIDFYPALYKSFGYISLFKELEKKELKPAVVSSFGFSSVVVALYAKNMKANIVEWKSYSLYQDLKEYSPYSKDWLKTVKDFLEKEFGNLKLSQLKILMLIPSPKGTGISVSPTKLVSKAIMKSLYISKQNSLMVKGDKNYLSSFDKYGVEIPFRVSLLPSRISMKNDDKTINKIYQDLVLPSTEKNNVFVQATDTAIQIDSIHNLSDEINQAYDFSKEILIQIENKIKK